MAFDLLRGTLNNRDWSIGVGDEQAPVITNAQINRLASRIDSPLTARRLLEGGLDAVREAQPISRTQATLERSRTLGSRIISFRDDTLAKAKNFTPVLRKKTALLFLQARNILFEADTLKNKAHFNAWSANYKEALANAEDPKPAPAPTAPAAALTSAAPTAAPTPAASKAKPQTSAPAAYPLQAYEKPSAGTAEGESTIPWLAIGLGTIVLGGALAIFSKKGT